EANANGHENETGPYQPDSRVLFDLESCKSPRVDSRNPDLVVFNSVAVKRPVSQNPLGRRLLPGFYIGEFDSLPESHQILPIVGYRELIAGAGNIHRLQHRQAHLDLCA